MVVRIAAIVFRTVPYQESSLIVTVFSREFGKIAVIAKGARKPKSRYAGLFDIGSLLELVIYHKESRSVQTLTEASYLSRNFSLRSDMDKMFHTQRIIELCAQMLDEQEVNESMWDFISTFLNWFETHDQVPLNLFPYVQLRLTEIQGIGISQLEADFETNEPIFFKGIDLDSGMITDRSHAVKFYPLSDKAIQFLILGIQSANAKLLNLEMSNDERKQLVHTLDQYLSYHIESVRARKTDQIYKDFL